MLAIHSKRQNFPKYKRSLPLLGLLAGLSLFYLLTGNAGAAGFNGPSCTPGFMCNYNTTFYTPSGGGCADYCGNTLLGQGNSPTGWDQPILRWIDNPTYNFERNPPAPVGAGQTITLELGFNSRRSPAGAPALTWANIAGAYALSSIAPSAGASYTPGVCIVGQPHFTATTPSAPYKRSSSPYAGSGNYSSCNPGDTGVTWSDPVVGVNVSVRHRLTITFSTAITSRASVCLRTHVSNGEYYNLMGVMGNGRSTYPTPTPGANYAAPMCFDVAPPSAAQPPFLGVDAPAACPVISGFAYDVDDPGAATRVDIYADGPAAPGRTPVWSQAADEGRADVNTVLGVAGNHGFHATIPPGLIDGGVHTFYVYAIDASNTVTGVGPAPGIAGHAGNGHIFGTDPIAVNTGDCGHHYWFAPGTVATPTGTGENPGVINFAFGPGYATDPPISASTPQCVNGITVIYHVYKQTAAGAVTSIIGPGVLPPGPGGCTGYPQNPFTNFSYAPTNYEAGDQFCISVSIDPSEGYAKTDGTQVSVTRGYLVGGPSCVTIHNKPFFKAYNGSVRAGGDYAAPCTGGGTLASWNNNTGGVSRGAGSTLSTLALIKITGVASALGSGQPPPGTTPGSALSFANRSTSGGVAPSVPANESPPLGGGYGGASAHCMTKPEAPPATTPLGGTVNINGLASGAYSASGPLTINGGTIPNNTNIAIYATGNVYITGGGIRYNGGSWTVTPTNATNDIPSFTLSVTGGYIYIDPSVTQLDGIYAAAKSGGVGGNIYTCASPSGPEPAGDMYDTCRNQLVINGAFVANQVNLMRTYGSLRNDPGATCSNNPGAPAFPGSCAGEVFRFSPELYLSNQPMQLPSNGAPQYDALTSLPPVL